MPAYRPSAAACSASRSTASSVVVAVAHATLETLEMATVTKSANARIFRPAGAIGARGLAW